MVTAETQRRKVKKNGNRNLAAGVLISSIKNNFIANKGHREKIPLRAAEKQKNDNRGDAKAQSEKI